MNNGLKMAENRLQPLKKSEKQIKLEQPFISNQIQPFSQPLLIILKHYVKDYENLHFY